MKRAARMLAILSIAFFLLPAAAKSAEPKRVNFALDWIVSGRHAPWFVALEKGFYAEEGLSVTISRGYGATDTIKRVTVGNVEIGFCSSVPVILARAEGHKVKTVAIIYARNPMAYFSLKTTGITKPKDLEGRSIGAEAGDSHRVLFPAFAAANGIDPAKVTFVTMSAAAKTQMLLTGKVDAIGNFIMQRPILEREAREIGIMPWADYGLDFIGNGVIARDEYITQQEETIRKFLAASVRGFRYAFANLDEATKILLKHDPILDADITRKEIEILKGLVVTEATEKHGIGYATREQIKHAIDLMRYYKLERQIEASELHTNNYLPRR